MDVAISRIEVGVRDLKNQLSRYLRSVADGDEVIVTDRGRPIARLVAIDRSANRLEDLIAARLVQAPKVGARSTPDRISTDGPISDLVAEQRR